MMAGLFDTDIDEKQLSALELMMEHADTLASNVAGAPRTSRRRRNNRPDARSMQSFLEGNTRTDHDYEDYELYVGPGSRAKNREMRERRAAAQAVPAARATVDRPANRDIDQALENMFVANDSNSDRIVEGLDDVAGMSAKTVKVLQDWLDWEKAEAFRRANSVRTDDAAPTPTVNLPAPVDNTNNTGGGLSDLLGGEDADFEDDRRGRRRGRRYGRGGRRNNRRRNRRNGFGSSRLGRVLGAALTVGGIGAALYAGSEAKQEAGEEFANGSDDVAATPTTPETARTQTAPDAGGMTQEQKDAAFDLSSTAALAVGSAKRIPLIGPAVSVLSAGYNAEQIANDDTLTEAEKKREQTKNVTSSGGAAIGATAGAWVGGALGSVVPIAGTAAGAALGSVVGGILGDLLGSKVGELISDKVEDSADKAVNEADKKREEDLRSQPPQESSRGFQMPSFMSGWFGGNSGGGGTYSGPQRASAPRAFDSKQITDFASKAAAGGLGSVSAQFESGGRGVGTVSSGRGDYGGVSYGAHQLATNNGSMMKFLNSKEGQPFLAQFGGQAPGTAGFNEAYKNLASTQGDAFSKAQDDYITRTHYAPQAAKLQNDLGLDVSKRGKAVQEMVYSTAVQYGGNTNAIKRALNGLDLSSMTDEQIINTVQQSKAANVGTDFRSSSADTQASVAARAENERKVLTQLDQDEKGKQRKEAVAKALTPADSELDRKVAEKFPGLGKGDGSVDPTATQVDANLKNLPDFTQQGSTVSAPTSQADKDRRLAELVGDKALDARAREMGATALDATPRSAIQASVSPEELAAARQKFRRDTFEPRLLQERDKAITPTQKPEPEVERQPLVTVDDVTPASERQAPAPVAAPVAASEPPRATARAVQGSSGGGKTHTMDDIPVFLDDPTLQMINVGYM
ncbi:putative endolysin [Erwinia phage vB_EamM_Yoloswag]|uniref:Putative endolysin n=1 Tax=Erwinia phage vB_EamM_Yoloswag TaxID=1958956 RepID=A0A1S6L351_9CAUD|nr:putative endolysin [Erwinia phage vB_EamM_Yoloswag]AQT28608.1 putative endolysin [Erwinia phage vB_EamM_Yoloswag]